MNKQIFIIIGAVIVLILIVTWAYLLIFGTPKDANDVFTELGLSGEEEEITFVPTPVVEEPVVDVEKPKLRQLTTKLVAGYREVTGSDGIPYVYYVEMGTGHIYSIDLNSSVETRLSGTTVKNTYKAEISPLGDYVAIASLENSKNMPLVLGKMSTTTESNLELTDFNETVRDFSISDKNELMYSSLVNGELVGYYYNLANKKKSNLFSIPFVDANIQWSSDGSTGSQYIFPKASYALEGFLYEVKNNKLTRLPLDGFGFSAAANNEMILYSYLEGNTAISGVYNRETGETQNLDAMVLPEKCFIPKIGLIFVCAYEATSKPYQFPDSWYRGETSFKDSLYAISGTEITSQLLIDTYTESSREIDIVDIKTGEKGEELYFINKNDNSLWMYEI